MRKLLTLLAILALTAPLAFYGCGSDGSDGATGTTGANGTNGAPGAPGATGATGAAGAPSTVGVGNIHGAAALAAEELATAGKYMVNVAITSATADAAGAVTVNFTVKKTSDNTAVTTVPSIGAGIFQLAPAGNGLSYNRWVPYLWRTETVVGTQDAAGNTFPMPAGTTTNQGYRESSGTGATNGTLVNNGGGSYTYTFKKNLATATLPDNVTLVGYDRTQTHRLTVTMGGHNGPTGEGDLDFVPNGAAVTATRNIVVTATCKKCHGPEFAGHGGDRVTVEGCVTCHSPGSYDAQSGNTLEMSVMIHKIHAGNELPTVEGPDGHFYDDPATPANEMADNGKYIIWGNGTTAQSWENGAFPAVLSNCVACHTGGAANVNNWQTVPSRAACGSCHDDVNFATGLNHAGGAFANDTICAGCHPATGIVPSKSVTEAHDWTKKDIRNISEFDITVTTDTPARGYYVNGEKPVISIALKDHFTQAVVVPNTVIAEPTTTPSSAALEGCIPVVGSEGTLCTVPRDGLFAAANVYVTGPRAQRIPVLTRPARAKVLSNSAGPWDTSALTAANRVLRVKVDSAVSMFYYDVSLTSTGYGADKLASGDISVTLAADNNLTVDKVVTALNADANFKLRAIAYKEEFTDNTATDFGKLGIRSRGVLARGLDGNATKVAANPNVLLVTAPANIFTANAYGVRGGAASARILAVAANTDPKASFTDPTAIKYALDNVDDLVPGTYMINVEFNDGGNKDSANGNYRTPSVALATFQVKKAAEEKPIANGCTACHWSDAGVGFILDYPRHHKLFNEKAVDHCGGCHDYTSGENPVTASATGTTTYTPFAAGNFSSGHPISKRVHAVHNGVNLTYPTITVAHEETEAFGRNWRITYPMDIRNCESCHNAATTSGTWKTNPNRLACMGCHDTDKATAHINAQTYDPTPYAPWNGDELESCAACH